MVAWKRFPVPEFDHARYHGMDWHAPTLLSLAEAQALAQKSTGGDAKALGGHAFGAGPALAGRFGFSGPHLHAVACLVPKGGAHLFGRSHAWKIQRMVLIEWVGEEAGQLIVDWKTPRPMNTRFGPDDGVELAGGAYTLLCGHKYGAGWIGSRTIIENGVATGEGRTGFHVLAASDDRRNDFCHVCLTFDWPA